MKLLRARPIGSFGLALLCTACVAFGVPGLAEAAKRHMPSAGAQPVRPPPAPHTLAYRVIHMRGSLRVGAHGAAVRLLQDELARRRYEVPINGVFDEATGRAVLAFRKVIGLQRVETANAGVFQLLRDGAGHYRVRYPRDGNHVEANLTKQVLVEVERGGRVRRIYTVSSGKPSTPTVLGRFQVYVKTPGTNSEGMVDSNYFIRGYAIHGYAEVPVYAASHGCLRIPIPNAAEVYAWVQVGYGVDVYTEGGVF
jgi:hypothetical protein